MMTKTSRQKSSGLLLYRKMRTKTGLHLIPLPYRPSNNSCHSDSREMLWKILESFTFTDEKAAGNINLFHDERNIILVTLCFIRMYYPGGNSYPWVKTWQEKKWQQLQRRKIMEKLHSGKVSFKNLVCFSLPTCSMCLYPISVNAQALMITNTGHIYSVSFYFYRAFFSRLKMR